MIAMVAPSLGANREVSKGVSLGVSKEGSLAVSKEGSLVVSKEGSLEANRQGSMVVSRVLEAHHSLQASCCVLESDVYSYMLNDPFVGCHEHLIIGPISQALLHF
jgi:hypothetical protein